MGSRGLTLNAAIKLTTSEFMRGVKQVQKSLNTLKSTFLQVAGALGAGLGLGALVSEVRQTATQLSIAKATLENVSKSSEEYADNLAFLRRISQAYGQDVLGLSQAYAKFRAAAGYAGVELKEIRKIYESLTRAAGAYHLTAEQTANAMLAVEQMFSKGKVTSEELRRQLGNALPGAFGLMAKAAKMSTGEFEKAMKAGQILAVNVLPAFADELNKVTQGANFDSLQSSLNRISNAWTTFTEKSGFEKFFKSIIDTGGKSLEWLGDRLSVVLRGVASALVGIGAGKFFAKAEREGEKAMKTWTRDAAVLRKENQKLEKEIGKTGSRLADIAANRGKETAFYVEGLTAAEAKMNGLDKGLVKIIADNESKGKNIPGYMLKSADATTVFTNRLNQSKKAIASNQAEIAKLSRGTTAFGRAWIGAGRLITGVVQSIRAALASIGFGLLISALTFIGQKALEIITFSSKLKKKVKEVNEEVRKLDSVTHSQLEEAKLLVEQIKEAGNNEKERQGYLNRLNELMGLQGQKALTVKSTLEEINKEVEKWSNQLVKVAQREAMLRRIGELTAENAEKTAKARDIRTGINSGKYKLISGFKAGEAERLEKQVENNLAIIATLEAEVKELTKELGITNSGGNGGGGGGGGNETAADLKKALDRYKEKLKELNNQLANGAISQEEYTKGVGELSVKTWKEIAAFDNLDKNLKSLGKSYVILGNQAKESSKDWLDAEELRKYNEEVEKIQKRFNDIIDNPINEPSPRDTFRDYKKSDSEILGEELDIVKDYQKEYEKVIERLEELKRDAGDKWSEEMQKILDELKAKLREVSAEASGFEQAMKFAELQEDIDKFSKTLRHETFDSIKDFATAFDRLIDSIESVGDALKELSGIEIFDEDSFNKVKAFMTILNEIFQTIDTVRSVMEGLEKVKEANLALDKAQAAMDAAKKADEAVQAVEALTAAESAQIAVNAVQQAQEVEGATATVAAEAAKTVAAEATTKAYSQEAIAAAAAHAATLGGPLAGSAAAIEMNAALQGVLASVAAFAKGGIVGGSSYSGDKNLVRANSGEMILTRGQQKALFDAINNNTINSAGNNVEFKIRGCDLVGALKNYGRVVK